MDKQTEGVVGSPPIIAGEKERKRNRETHKRRNGENEEDNARREARAVGGLPTTPQDVDRKK